MVQWPRRRWRPPSPTATPAWPARPRAALAGRPSARAQGALVRALDHRDDSVRRAAARAVSRWSGEQVDVAAPEAERRRVARRIADQLLALEGDALRSAVTRVRADGAGSSSGATTPLVQADRQPRAPPPPPPDPALAAAAVAEVRASLRGRTADEIASALAREPALVARSLEALVAQGALVARGPRYFMG